MPSNAFQTLSFNADSAYTGEALDCSHCSTVALQCVATGIDKADGTITLQKSVDGLSFGNVSSATTVAAAATTYIVEDEPASCAYYRAVWAKGSNAAGTVAVKILGKL